MFDCPQCGADRRAVAPIAPCPGCGATLAERDVVRPATLSEAADIELDEDTPPRRLRWLVGLALVGVLALVAVVIVIVGSGRSGSRARAAGVGGTHAAGASTERAAPEPPPPPPPQMPKWIALRVERVQVAGDIEWDGPVEESSFKEMCKDVSTLVGLVRPDVGGAARLGCSLFSEEQRQTDPRDPDLQLVLDIGGVSYKSYIAVDRRAHLFSYPFVIPGDVIPPEGLVLTVLDADDNADRGQEVGSVRLSHAEIISIATSGQLATHQDGSVSLLEFTARPHDGSLRKVEVTVDAKTGGREVLGLEVNAGDIVRVEASGTWQIGTWHNDWLGPGGYGDDRLKGSNLRLFPSDGHGAAVAVVGQQGRASLLRPRPCDRFVSNFSGVVWVGINDRETSDNNGEATFRVLTRAPKAAEWKSPGVLLGCDR